MSAEAVADIREVEMHDKARSGDLVHTSDEDTAVKRRKPNKKLVIVNNISKSMDDMAKKAENS